MSKNLVSYARTRTYMYVQMTTCLSIMKIVAMAQKSGNQSESSRTHRDYKVLSTLGLAFFRISYSEHQLWRLP